MYIFQLELRLKFNYCDIFEIIIFKVAVVSKKKLKTEIA